MHLILSLVNALLKAIAWGLAVILGLLTAIVVLTVMSIAYSISDWAGLSFLGFVMMVVWMTFYATKS